MPNFWGWVKTESRANNWVKFKQLSQIDSMDGFDSKHWAIFFLSVDSRSIKDGRAWRFKYNLYNKNNFYDQELPEGNLLPLL